MTDAKDPRNSGGAFTASDTLRLAVWLALACGLVEGSYRLYQSGVRGFAIGISPHIIWMAPVANLVFLAVALSLVAAMGGFRRGRNQKLPVVLVVALTVLGLVLLYQAMHKGAAVLLAAGIGYQVAPRILNSGRMKRLVRRTTPVLALLAILGGLWITGYRRMEESRRVAALPEGTDGAPNVLLLVWDTVRGFSLSLHGHHRPTTPFTERLAAQGARFDLAMSTAPWTLPSHGSMFTGHRPSALSARLNVRLDDTYPVIAEAFARAGYVTGGFAANMSYVSREHGLARGFSHFRDFRLNPSAILGSSRLGAVLLHRTWVRKALGYFDLPGRKQAARVDQEFLGWVDGREGRPFFAFLNYFDAHQPYIAPRDHRARFTVDSTARFWPRLVDASFRDMTAEEIRWSEGEYEATIAYLDARLERLISELEQRRLLDNTIVVLTSDHGEHFGDHHRVSHGNSLYRQLLQVPLVIRYPARIAAGTVVDVPVSLADLPSTLVDLSGLATADTFPGRSLARFWEGNSRSDSIEVVLSEMPTAAGARALSLMANGYHYISWFGRPAQLYHLNEDPTETRDLATAPGAAEILRQFVMLETRYTHRPNQGD